MTLVVLRPEPGLSETLARAAAAGLPAVGMPLFTVRASAWTMPDKRPDALLLTSANAARLGGVGLAELRPVPVYTVGPATAAAARAAGFERVIAGDDGVDAIVARAAADGRGALLHLCGREHRAPTAAPLPIARQVVYAADPVAMLPPLPPRPVALLHSPRAAALFAQLAPDRAHVAIAAISEAARVAAGPGWRADAVAARPLDAALLAAAAKLCDGFSPE